MNRFHSVKDKTTFWLGLQTLRWADTVICVSHNSRKDLLEYGLVPPRRIHVVPPGPGLLPPDQSAPAGSDSLATQLRPYILYVGGYAPHKNILRLIAAFARLQAEQNLRLVLVGGGDTKQITATAEAIKEYRLGDRVNMFRNLSDDQLSSLYQNCTVFAYPSLYEGFGLPVLEAITHGAVVACSSTSSIPEVAGDAAAYFNPLSVRDIAEKLQLLYDNARLTRELRELGSRQTCRYSWKGTARSVHAIAEPLKARSA
jgi:glycosyltransferase involved in cell wall biosynthesis